MPYLSLIVPTMRVGGLDVLFNSVARSTFTDVEIVLVDGLYARRREMVAMQARDRFLAVRHVNMTPSPFPICAFSTYSNAGIMASTGEVLLFMVDYSHLPPDLLEKHAAFHKQDTTRRAGMMGPHRYVQFTAAQGFPSYGRDDIDKYAADARSGALDAFLWSSGTMGEEPSAPHAADGGATVPHDADPKLRHPAGPIGPEYYHGKNESVRRERVLEVDGYDTELDGAHLYQDTDFADRLTTKAGVSWTLDPSAVVSIVNPRNHFPFAKRLRSHESNKAIWEKKKAAGYPAPSKPRLGGIRVSEVCDDDPSVGRVAGPGGKLRIGMIYGEFSSYGHGPYEADRLYTKHGLTGSEGSFFNLARTFAQRGHEVAVFCETTAAHDHPDGFSIFPLSSLPKFSTLDSVDAVLAWNEPDYLRFAPVGALRVCDQQLNDFGYAGGGWYQQAGRWIGPHVSDKWRTLVDLWVSPSANHKRNVMAHEGIPESRCVVIPNSVDLDLFNQRVGRNLNRAVWCSSPDRGLHHALSMWPEIKRRNPSAELHVFYALASWINRARDIPDEIGRRARYIEHALNRLGGYGVYVHDAVPNAQMARELMASACLMYPCDPVRYTEGFGCSVLDAAAAGCVPVISAADALPEVHGDAAVGIVGNPSEVKEAWVESIAAAMGGHFNGAEAAMRRHADKHSRHVVADTWERTIKEYVHARRGEYQNQDVSRNDVSIRRG